MFQWLLSLLFNVLRKDYSEWKADKDSKKYTNEVFKTNLDAYKKAVEGGNREEIKKAANALVNYNKPSGSTPTGYLS